MFLKDLSCDIIVFVVIYIMERVTTTTKTNPTFEFFITANI